MIIAMRSPIGKGIGILLIMASFVNWGYVGEQIAQSLPHLPFLLGVII